MGALGRILPFLSDKCHGLTKELEGKGEKEISKKERLVKEISFKYARNTPIQAINTH